MNNKMSTNKSKIRILLTGTHNTPPLAVWKELKRRGYSNFLWVGQRKSIIGDKNFSTEYIITKKYGIPFQNIFAGKIRKDLSLHTLIWLARVPIGFVHSLIILLKFRPHIIVTFGSHVGLPITIVGKLLNIPIVAHIQPIITGLADQIIQKFADIVCYSWKESKKYLKVDKSNNKYIFTGNPIREGTLKPKNSKISLNFKKKRITIFFTGGNQGAHILNELVRESIEILAEKYNVIHQTGRYSETKDYEKLKELAKKINKDYIKYLVFDYLLEDDMGLCLKMCDLVVSRSGANSCYEYLALEKPAILIPLPFSTLNEQFINATVLKNAGVAIVVNQLEVTPQKLVSLIDNFIANLENYKKAAKNAKNLVTLNATEKICDIIEKEITNKYTF